MRIAKTLIWLLAAASCSTELESQNVPRQGTGLRDFFQRLTEHYDPATLPSFEQLLSVQDQISSAPSAAITNALPYILLAADHKDLNVQIDAAAVLITIARRPDSAELLHRNIGAIANLLNSRDARLQATPPLVFLELKPHAPHEIVPILVSFLNRRDRDTHAQTAAMGVLAHYAPEDPAAVEALKGFLSRELDRGTRIDALNALGAAKFKDYQIIDAVIASLEDPDPGVRLTAVQVIPSLGHSALLQAEPALQRLSTRPGESEDVRRFVSQALDSIQHHH